MSDRFIPGTRVRLQSGGPYMTVEQTVNGRVFCTWFHDNELKQATFIEAMLSTKEDQVARVARVHRSLNDIY